MKKGIMVLIIWFLIIPLYLFADCEHCYTVAKVKLQVKDNTIKEGYSPLYGWYFKGKKNLLEGCELKTKFVIDVKEIQFFNRYYSFPEIGSIVIKEGIEKIPINEITKIILVKWEKISGAGEVGNLSRIDVEKIIKKGISSVERIIGNVSDTIFINLNKKLSNNTFKKLIRYSPYSLSESIGDSFYYIHHVIVFGKVNKDEKYNVQSISNMLQDAILKEKKEIETLNIPTEDKEIDKYLSIFRAKFNLRIKFYNAILLLVRDNDKRLMEEFILRDVDEQELKKILSGNLRSLDSYKDTLRKTEIITKQLYKYLILPIYQKEFDELLSKKDIIMYIWSWD